MIRLANKCSAIYLLSSLGSKGLQLDVHIDSLFLAWLDQLIAVHRVEFEDVHRLADGQVKHSTEVFYAGSLWKVGFVVLNLYILLMA